MNLDSKKIDTVISLKKLRKSKAVKGVIVFTLFNFVVEICYPTMLFALTGGPAQPEFSSFEPIGTSDMVNLSSGDFTYNIPLMDVGGYPLNIAYDGSPSMDQEASWVGLGWSLSAGQINRQVRGIPDDFHGDEIIYENHQKENVTVGGNVRLSPGVFGAKTNNIKCISVSLPQKIPFVSDRDC